MQSVARKVAALLVTVGVVGAAAACRTTEDVGSDEGADTGGGASLYRAGNRFSGWSKTGTETDHYLDDIQPILAQRCVTCHGCTTAACQLKLTSFEGIQRGANKHNLFVPGLISSAPSRMKDGNSVDEWREKGFYSVTDGAKTSVMYRLLEHGKEDNTDGFDLANPFSLYKGKVENLGFECTNADTRTVDKRVAKSGTGMPFGLTTLPQNEYDTLTKWIEEGAKGPSEAAQQSLAAARDPDTVQRWEAFFNTPGPKAQLAMRYIYEHLFYGRLHFDESDASKGDFFEVVRATSKTGPVVEVVTETPSDDPVKPFVYRLKKHTQIITAKDHTVWHLTDSVMSHWKELFLDAPWDVAQLPGYASQNPFVVFDAIPGKIRDEFMIENSQHLIEAMVKGDVCNGASATYAIRDRFFTLFLKPDSDPSAIDPKLGGADYDHLDPTSGSGRSDDEFQNRFETQMKALKPGGLSEQDLWDGNKTDKNAWVTVFRHGKSASAHLGPMGQLPETMWVLDYGNFERLYYDLVVLFRVWGSAAHQIDTWRTMSHVRAHGEDLFLMFLPEEMREKLRLQFTPGAAGFTENPMRGEGIPSGLQDVDPNHPLEDFVKRIRLYLGADIAGATTLDPDPMSAGPQMPTSIRNQADLEAGLYALTVPRGQYSDALPDLTWITVTDGNKKYDYTLLANRIYWSNSRLIGNFISSVNRRPELDSMSVVRGHLGAFPELFMEIPMAEVGAAIKAGVTSQVARMNVRRKYEIRRNSPQFWTFLDNEHTRQLAQNPLEAGIIDSSEYLWPIELQGPKEPLSAAPPSAQ